MKSQLSAAARQSFVRAEDSHRHNRRERFRDDKSKTGQCGLQISVERAAAFRENEDAMSRAQNADQRLERAAIAAFLIDRNDIEFRQKPAEEPGLRGAFCARENKSRVCRRMPARGGSR